MYFRFVAFFRSWLHPRSALVVILGCSAAALLIAAFIVPRLAADPSEPRPDQEWSRLEASSPVEKQPVEVLAVALPSEAQSPVTALVITVPSDPEAPTESQTPGSQTPDSQTSEPPVTEPPTDATPVSEPSAGTPAVSAQTTKPPTSQSSTSKPPVTATSTTSATTTSSTAAPTTQPPTTDLPTTQPPATGKPQPSGSIQPCSNPIRVQMNTSSISSALKQAAGQPCVVIEMQPGKYPSISVSGLQQVTMTCAQADGCAVARIVVSRVQQLIVEGLRFTGGHDYGIMAYETDRLLVRNNQFINASNGHDISLKNLVGYTEILNNTFVECTRHCLELGQNGNIRTRPSTSGVAVVRGNVFERPLINAITQRGLCTLIIEDNEFIDVAGWAVQTWPYWAKYPYGGSGDDGTLYVPKCPTPRDQVNGQTGPMRTTVSNNTFSGNARLGFEGRGVKDDTVEVTGNTGSFTCRFSPMAGRTQAATADEETAAAPSLVPGSQC